MAEMTSAGRRSRAITVSFLRDLANIEEEPLDDYRREAAGGH